MCITYCLHPHSGWFFVSRLSGAQQAKAHKRKGALQAPRDHMFGLFATGYRNRAEDILAPAVDLQHDGTPLAALARHYL